MSTQNVTIIVAAVVAVVFIAAFAGNYGYNNNYQQGSGWLDLDSANIGNGSMDGLTNDERKTVMTFWCIECSPH